GGAGRPGRKLVQVRKPPYILKLARYLDRLGDREDVRGLVVFDEPRDGAPDEPMVMSVEIRFGDQVADAIPRGIAEQQATESGLLRLHGVRRQSQRFDLRVPGYRAGTGKAFGTGGNRGHLALFSSRGAHGALPSAEARRECVTHPSSRQRISVWISCGQPVHA